MPYCSFDIMTMTHSQFKFCITEATGSNKSPRNSLLTFLQRRIDIKHRRREQTVLHIDIHRDPVHRIYMMVMQDTCARLAAMCQKELVRNHMWNICVCFRDKQHQNYRLNIIYLI